MSTASSESLLEFPCEFPIKIFGLASEQFQDQALAIIAPHIPAPDILAVQSRASRGGQYTAVTVTITATSKQQLDLIYQALTASPVVIMAL